MDTAWVLYSCFQHARCTFTIQIIMQILRTILKVLSSTATTVCESTLWVIRAVSVGEAANLTIESACIGCYIDRTRGWDGRGVGSRAKKKNSQAGYRSPWPTNPHTHTGNLIFTLTKITYPQSYYADVDWRSSHCFCVTLRSGDPVSDASLPDRAAVSNQQTQ